MKVILNAAASIDGKIATVNGVTKISSNQDLIRVHRLRSKVDAILIGINTVTNDDPLLTSRVTKINNKMSNTKSNGLNSKTNIYNKNVGSIRYKNPIRIILDSKASIPITSQIVRTANQVETIIAVTKDAPKTKLVTLSRQGVKIKVIEKEPDTNGRVDLKKLLDILENEGISTILVEGGGEVNWSFIKLNLFDEIIITISPIIIGGRSAPTLVDGEGYHITNNCPSLLLIKSQKKSTGELVLYYKNPNKSINSRKK